MRTRVLFMQMKGEMKQKMDELNRKICNGVVSGKLKFTEHMNVIMAEKNLQMALELEEYKAAQIFKEYIDKLKNS